MLNLLWLLLQIVSWCMCLQAINFKKYSTASDVWSFGVLMYEIWTLGHRPFEGRSNPEVIICTCIHIFDSVFKMLIVCSTH